MGLASTKCQKIASCDAEPIEFIDPDVVHTEACIRDSFRQELIRDSFLPEYRFGPFDPVAHLRQAAEAEAESMALRKAEADKEISALRDELSLALRRNEECMVSSENKCVICFESSPSCCLIPCGHQCICEVCAPSLKACPICRRPVTLFVKVFVAAPSGYETLLEERSQLCDKLAHLQDKAELLELSHAESEEEAAKLVLELEAETSKLASMAYHSAYMQDRVEFLELSEAQFEKEAAELASQLEAEKAKAANSGKGISMSTGSESEHKQRKQVDSKVFTLHSAPPCPQHSNMCLLAHEVGEYLGISKKTGKAVYLVPAAGNASRREANPSRRRDSRGRLAFPQNHTHHPWRARSPSPSVRLRLNLKDQCKQ